MSDKKPTITIPSTPTPNQHNLMAEVPTRRYSKILGIMVVVLVVVVVIGGISWFFVINKSFNKPTVEVKKETQDTEREESQVLAKDAYLIAQLPLDEKTNLAGISLLTVDFNERKVSELYTSKVKEKPDLIDVVNDKVIYAELVDGRYRKIVSYDVETKKAETLLETKAPLQYDGYHMSPDKDRLVFTETCGLECSDAEQFVIKSDVKIYEIKTQKIKLLRSFERLNPYYTISGSWITSKNILIDYVCGCDAPRDYSKYELLDVENGNVLQVALSSKVNSAQIDVQGERIVYTTLELPDTEETPKELKSSVVLKDIASGSEKILRSSAKIEYRVIKWLDEQSVLMQLTHADKFESGLFGWAPVGKVDLVILNLEKPQSDDMAFVTGSDFPVVFGVSSPYILFAKESPFVGPKAQTTKTLSVYNYLNDETFLLNTPLISSAELIY